MNSPSIEIETGGKPMTKRDLDFLLKPAVDVDDAVFTEVPNSPEVAPKDQAFDPTTNWQSVDSASKQFCKSLTGLWEDQTGHVNRVLLQKSILRCMVISLAAGMCGLVVANLIAKEFVQLGVIGTVLSLLITGVIALAACLVFEKHVVADKTALTLEKLGSAISDRLVEKIITEGSAEIKRHILHLKLGDKDSGATAVACMQTVFRVWREMYLIPYILQKEWEIFRFAKVLKTERRVARVWYRCFLLAVTAAFAVIVGAKIAYADEFAPSIGGAALSGGWISFLIVAVRCRLFLLRRMEIFVGEIERRSSYHLGDGAKSPTLWQEIIAQSDPAPTIAHKLKEAYDFIARHRVNQSASATGA
jgi:hypothetical protein